MGVPVPCLSLIDWAIWSAANPDKRIVKKEYVGEFWISTVFLGIDYNHTADGPPILWETLVFKGGTSLDGEHYDSDHCAGSCEQAEAMHAAMVEKCKCWQ
jgi:hypothetical protein